jgi:AbrB family looped-hinge helix DNA binding protein
MPTSTLTSKGQITLPRAVRERLGVKQGDRVEFSVDGDRVLLRPARADVPSRVVGLLRHLRRARPVSVEQMRAAVRRRALRKAGGSRS